MAQRTLLNRITVIASFTPTSHLQKGKTMGISHVTIHLGSRGITEEDWTSRLFISTYELCIYDRAASHYLEAPASPS